MYISKQRTNVRYNERRKNRFNMSKVEVLEAKETGFSEAINESDAKETVPYFVGLMMSFKCVYSALSSIQL